MTAASPKTAVVIGAGIVGLSTAWHLQEFGIQVTVIDREDVAAGASWGNAGWLTPSLAAPLPEPSVLRYGLKALADRSSPLVVPLRPSRSLAAFLGDFSTHCRASTWASSMAALRPLNDAALEAYDVMVDGDVESSTVTAPVLCAFLDESRARPLLDELRLMVGAGQVVQADLLSAAELAEAEPMLSSDVRFGVRLHGQRYLDPAAFTRALADSVVTRGGNIRAGWPVSHVGRSGDRVVVHGSSDSIDADVVVVATGAWLEELVRPHGVRVRVQAGRGYSLTVPIPSEPAGPLYFPAARLACTPVSGGRLRIAGMMEFGSPDAPGDLKRWDLLLSTVAPYLPGVGGESVKDRWVGPRPVSADGLPLIGATRTPGVYVAGGHGMWGVTLGPITGRVLAEAIVGGEAKVDLRPVSPLRGLA